MDLDVEPLHYQLEFEPDLENSTFLGRAEILVLLSKPVSSITMDCADLEITSCKIVGSPNYTNAAPKTETKRKHRKSDASTKNTVPSTVKVDAKRERLIIRFPRGCTVSKSACIQLTFSGVLNDNLLGFYRSKYMVGKEVRYLATTQFEAADARRAFPCWDRPDVKATFGISIVVKDAKHNAVSNMRLVSKSDVGGKTRYKFDTSPVMSTYLVYMGVGEFEYTGGKTKNGTTIRIVTTRTSDTKNKQIIKHAMQYAKKLLVAYEEYFGIKYPLSKLDLIAIPDFAAGAMENWGAITFRENLLLYDPKSSSTRTKQLIAEVISHELAHQWFGNMATMKWWNDLWLNESFATFMATKLLDQMHPEWDLWGQFLTGAMNPAMNLDSLHSTHPIDVPVKSPAQIREIFDSISYDKGGCVLRMLEQYVGKGPFRRGLQMYLKKYQGSNASGSDLWRCIENVAEVSIMGMMDSWLKKPGFPVVRVWTDTKTTTSNQNTKTTKRKSMTVYLHQERYLHQSPARKDRTVWPIPLSIRTAGRPSKHMLDTRSLSIDVPWAPAVVVNPRRTGFYRVRYDDGLLRDLMVLAKKGQLEASDLWSIQNDLFAMCVSGQAHVREYLDILDDYASVTDYATLSDVGHNLSYLCRLSFGEKFAVEIVRSAIKFYKRVHDITGWVPIRGEDHTVSLLRGPAVTSLGLLGDPDVIEISTGLYSVLTTSEDEIPADLIDPVCTIVAWNSGRGSNKESDNSDLEIHTALVDLYTRAQTAEQSLRYLGAMCEFKSQKLLEETLNFAVSEHVRSQNMALPILRVAANPCGRDILWPWLHKNWTRVLGKAGHGNPLLGRIISGLSHLHDTDVIPEMRRFFAENPVPGTERTLQQTVERIEIGSAMRARLASEFGAKRSIERVVETGKR